MAETLNPVDGTRIRFEESGEGPALVLVHGSGLSSSIWRGFGYTKALRSNYRVLALDLRGHGRSGKPSREEDYRMDLVVADVLAVLDAAGVDSAHYFGYSFGARTGFSLAQQHPERLLSFVSAGGTYRPLEGQISKLFFPGYDRALEAGGMPEFVRQWGVAAGKPVDPQTAAAFLANDAVALSAYFRRSEKEQGIPEEQLKELAVPALLLAGTEDGSRFRDSQRAATLMPEARFEALPGRDHGRTLTPSAEVLQLVEPFLAQMSARFQKLS